jgi:hypothetical protein
VAYQLITVDGKAFVVTSLQITPWLPHNPAAALNTDLQVLSGCRFDISGRNQETDESFSFFGLAVVDGKNWPPMCFRSAAAPANGNQGQKVMDMVHW